MPLFFKPHRPLRPERKERTPVPFLAGLAIHSSDPIFLSVSVVRALNVPEKMEGSHLHLNELVQLRFYITVYYT